MPEERTQAGGGGGAPLPFPAGSEGWGLDIPLGCVPAPLGLVALPAYDFKVVYVVTPTH